VMQRLAPLLDTAPMTVTGCTVAENLRDAAIHDGEVIRPLDRPFASQPPIVILRGSLAPDGGVVKLGLRRGRRLKFRGRAKVFETPDASVEAIRAGRIAAGDVIVLRGVGVIGGPGMGGASRTVFALDGAPFGAEVAVVTDGQLSGLVNVGLVVGEVKPEAAVGGPLALVEDGDEITIDIEAKTIVLEVPAEELEARRARWQPKPPSTDSVWLSVYQRTVAPLAQGATLVSRKKDGW
jgi:dihydroxy-acid dehydratase